MRTLSRLISRFCYDHPRLGIRNLTRYLVIGMVVVYTLAWLTHDTLYSFFALYPSLVLQGEIWRLVTFIFIPVNTGLFWFVFEVLFLYFIGTNLEKFWGTTRFTVFFFLGTILNMVLTFATYFLLPVLSPSDATIGFLFSPSMTYIKLSMFLAFATIYPESYITTYFIISVKAKWLALIAALAEVLLIVRSLLDGDWFGILLVAVALLNYLLFFWEDLLKLGKRQIDRAAHQVSPQTLNFKAAQRRAKSQKGYLRKCAVCGLTDAQDPNMEFRFCSKCNGYYCYCSKHINDHAHVR